MEAQVSARQKEVNIRVKSKMNDRLELTIAEEWLNEDVDFAEERIDPKYFAIVTMPCKLEEGDYTYSRWGYQTLAQQIARKLVEANVVSCILRPGQNSTVQNPPIACSLENLKQIKEILERERIDVKINPEIYDFSKERQEIAASK